MAPLDALPDWFGAAPRQFPEDPVTFDDWIGEMYEHDRHRTDDDENITIRWPDNGTGRGEFIERLPAERLVARRVNGRQLGLVQHPNPEAGYRIDYDPPGNVIPPEMPGEDADGPHREDTGANPVAANIRVQGTWAERNHTVPVEADVVISDENGEHYRPEITHAVARMTGAGVVTRDVRAVDRYGIWEIRYIENYPGLHRVDGDAIIRRIPHEEATARLRAGRGTLHGVVTGARPWGTNTATNFMWDVPLQHVRRIELDRLMYRPGAEDLLIQGGEPVAQQLNEKAQRQFKEAETRAEKLLRTLLTPEQLKDYEEKRCFYMQVNHELFRVDFGTTGNVKRINPENGDVEETYCIHMPYAFHEVPTQDVMLAQKLLLETNPEQFKQTANRWGPRQQGIQFANEAPQEAIGRPVINWDGAERLIFDNGAAEQFMVHNDGADVQINAPMHLPNGVMRIDNRLEIRPLTDEEAARLEADPDARL